jgi:hypothetical protein
MATLVLDTFTDTNSTSLLSHTPDTDVEAGGWVGPSSVFTIQSNQLQFTSGSGYDWWASIDAGSNDDVVLTVTHVSSTGDWNGIYVGGTSAPTTGGTGNWPTGGGGIEADIGLAYTLYERHSGGNTQRDINTSVIPTSGSEAWKVEVTTTSITFYVDDEEVLSYSPGGSLTFDGTHYGIKIGSAGTSVFDNFQVAEADAGSNITATKGSITVAGLTPTVTNTGASSGSIDVRTAADNDVAFYNHTTTSYFQGGDTMYTLEQTATQYGNAVRWQLNVPKNATITSVTLTFYESQSVGAYDEDDVIETVGFEQTDNAAQFSSGSDYATRYANLGTTDTIDMVELSDVYTPTTDWPLVGEPLTFTLSPTLIQEVVNRSGWASGQYVMLFMRTSGSDTEIAQWQGHYNRTSPYWPRLQVGYTVNGNLGATAQLGQATVAGLTATVSVTDNETVTAALGQATVTGYTAEVEATTVEPINVTANAGAVTTAGFTPTIENDVSVTAALGTATVAGLTATVENDVSITAAAGAATAAGLTATVTATADVPLTATLGQATVAGLTATVSFTADVPLTATLAEATVAGLTATVTATANVPVTAGLGAVTGAALTATVGQTAYETVALTPTADVARDGIVTETDATTNLYASVDDVWGTPDDDTTYLKNASRASGTATLALSDLNPNMAPLSLVRVRIRAKRVV